MNRVLIHSLLLISFGTAGAQKPVVTTHENHSSEVSFNLIQLNDVYEITPVSREGGMAKVATVVNAYKRTNPNTFLVLAGDFFSPSALGTAKVNGERLAGKQMVAILNQIPLTLATFGNHEFDVKEDQFRQRMTESQFGWVSSNCFNTQGKNFDRVEENRIQVIRDGEKIVRVGYFGVTLPSNPAGYVKYTDFLQAAEKQVKELRPKVDVLIALTHLAYEDDMRLSKALPEIDMIIGGHEHEQHRIEIASLPGIYKADANARSIFVHSFAFNPTTRQLRHSSHLEKLTADVPEDPTVKAEVDKWVQLAFDGFRKDGFNPEARVCVTQEVLDGLEATVRNKPNKLASIIADGMLAAAPGTDLALYNGGSIRIDDKILPGEITEYDVIRILPFGGKIVSIQVNGAFLRKILAQGIANKGQGGYLQTANVSYDQATPLVNGKPIVDSQTYKVALSDFLLTGNETGFAWLKKDGNPEIKVLGEHADIRNATIAQLKKVYP